MKNKLSWLLMGGAGTWFGYGLFMDGNLMYTLCIVGFIYGLCKSITLWKTNRGLATLFIVITIFCGTFPSIFPKNICTEYEEDMYKSPDGTVIISEVCSKSYPNPNYPLPF